MRQFDVIESRAETTQDFDIPYEGEGSALLVYVDENNVEHKEIIIGYLMPYNEVFVTINSADENGLSIEVEQLK